MPWDNRVLKQKAINQTTDVYVYETPFPNYDELKNPKLIERFDLKGVDKLNLGLKDLNWSELSAIFKKYIDEWNPSNVDEKHKFTKNPKFNLTFPEFDAFVLYAFIRHYQPKMIIEIGSGQSTRVMVQAIMKNNNGCQLTCIEPYNDSIVALKDLYPINIIKDKLENVDQSIFTQLGKNDLVFIDSTHVLKPFGDVEYEYLYILPNLKDGCIVHIHDIFYPYNYPLLWTVEWKCVLTEQQLLMAFMYGNRHWKCLCANNYMINDKSEIIPNKLKPPCGGSFWIQKIG